MPRVSSTLRLLAENLKTLRNRSLQVDQIKTLVKPACIDGELFALFRSGEHDLAHRIEHDVFNFLPDGKTKAYLLRLHSWFLYSFLVDT